MTRPWSRELSGVNRPVGEGDDPSLLHQWVAPNEQSGFVPSVHQATGRLMARFSVTPAEALMWLRELADRLGLPLSVVAAEIAEGGLAPFEDELVFVVGPTADSDLVLLGEHIAGSALGVVDGLLDGPG